MKIKICVFKTDVTILDDQFVQHCNCVDSKELQNLLVNHILSHTVPYDCKEEEEEVVESLDPGAIEEDAIVQDVAEEVYVDEEYVVDNDTDHQFDTVTEEEVYMEEQDDEDNQQFTMVGDESEDTDSSLNDSTIKKERRKNKSTVIYKCENCEWQTSSRRKVYDHLQNEHDESNHLSCPYAPKCKNVFKNQIFRNKHINWHIINESRNEKGELYCQTCGILCEDKKSLLAHIASHNRYYCDYCPKSYAQYHNMKKHVIEHINGKKLVDKKMILCDLCSQLVPSERLKRHLYTFHCDEKLFQCRVCSKEFKHAESLKSHLDAHNGVPRYECEYCSKKFFNCSNYKSHMYRHTDPDRFKCSVCGERYGSSKSLSQHYLRNHENLEDKQKFPCTFEGCDKFYYTLDQMKTHVKRVHFKKAESPQPCPHCTYVANSKKNIQRHKWRVHKVKTRNRKVFT